MVICTVYDTSKSTFRLEAQKFIFKKSDSIYKPNTPMYSESYHSELEIPGDPNYLNYIITPSRSFIIFGLKFYELVDLSSSKNYDLKISPELLNNTFFLQFEASSNSMSTNLRIKKVDLKTKLQLYSQNYHLHKIDSLLSHKVLQNYQFLLFDVDTNFNICRLYSLKLNDAFIPAEIHLYDIQIDRNIESNYGTFFVSNTEIFSVNLAMFNDKYYMTLSSIDTNRIIYSYNFDPSVYNSFFYYEIDEKLTKNLKILNNRIYGSGKMTVLELDYSASEGGILTYTILIDREIRNVKIMINVHSQQNNSSITDQKIEDNRIITLPGEK